jgi:hypothetical protein
MSEILTEIPQDFLNEFQDHILGTIPEEKVQVELRQVGIARVMQAVGPEKIEGLGQKIAEIDARLYFRLLHDANDPTGGWIKEYLADNPNLCAPGYKPRGHSLRHGKTFLNGKPV